MSFQNHHPFMRLEKTTMRTQLGKTGRIFIFMIFLMSLLGTPTLHARAATITFTGAELLGRPTDTSISVLILPDSTITLYYEFGTTSGVYTGQTAQESAIGGQPKVTVISGLMADTKYYYRMQYSTDGGSTWTARPEYSFHTQRAAGDTFTFTVTSDSHVNIMLGSATEWTKTMNNVAADHPDFEIDLGDTFAMDGVTSVATAETNYKYQYQFFNLVSASAPIFLAVGNHEQQEGWHLDDTTDPTLAPPIIGTNAEKKYYLNPVPDSFYSGNTDTYDTLGGDELREDYYAWTWGDALFVVIDPYWYTMTKPFVGNTGGGEPETGDGDRWHWTLGVEQYNWLKTTLENSDAKYKFMFAHHMTGGSDDYVRGGANPANLVEWGGYNEAGTTYEWDTKRPLADGWGSQPVHQLMVANNVSAFFHGHDHQYAYEMRDGVVYQSLPAAGFTGNGFNIYTTGSGYTIQALPSDGHMRVTVTPEKATVDYIKSTGATNAYTYDILPSGPTHNLTTAVSPAAGGTINPAAGEHSYSEGSVVPVTAVAAGGYKFDHWEGDCTGSGTCSVTMDADKSVTAVFTLRKVRDDYDGDGKTDAIKFAGGTGAAWWYKSGTSAWEGMWLGTEADMSYVGASDFDGDGQTDLAKFISSTGAVWYYQSGTSGWDGKWLGPEAFTYVAGSDFDGDGQADPAKFVASTGAVWYLQSSTGTWDGKWLGPETMDYVSGSDFDGDGKTDPAKFVPSTNVLWYLGSDTGSWTGVYLGSEAFSYVAASDFDGDGKTDPAKFNTGTGVLWYLSSKAAAWEGVSLGVGTYTYVAGCDFNGDGQTDPAKYDGSTGMLSWYNGSIWTDIDMGTDSYIIGNGQ
jgi:hypothetical protein